MKAIIPVAGTGAKLRPHTYTQPKALMPLAGRTVLDFTIEQLINAGVGEFIFIIGYLGEKIEEHVQQRYPQLVCHFVQQDKREGTGHAIRLAKNIVNNDELIIIMGDTITDFNLREIIDTKHTILAVKNVDDPRGFGVVEIGTDGYIKKLVEKPNIPISNTVLVGVYKIKETNVLFSCLEELFSNKIRTQGEYHLTDALECMLQKGVKMLPFKVKRWFDCGRKDTLLETNAFLLKSMGSHIHPSVETTHAIIIPPVSIGANTEITGSIIGPHVAIGENSKIKNVILKDAIVGSYSELQDIVIHHSLIGSDVILNGFENSLNIGDNTEIKFNN